MIAGIFWEGSGLGNQLFRYVMTRVIALDNGYEFGMIDPHLFKGKYFLGLDCGKPLTGAFIGYKEKRIDNEDGVDIRSYDWEVKNIPDQTIIDGEFQGEEYFKHRLDEIREWLAVIPLDMPDDLCVINFRGGEYTGVTDLFLPKEYWDTAIVHMREKYPDIQFEVHTDDPITAEQFFPDFPIVSNMELNWRSIRYAKHLILSNSSFAILPALLNRQVKEIIAPRFWARRNKGFWALPYNEYSGWTYL